ncbi:MAG: (Fe-S)-binding protein [bacterium]
MIDVEAIVKATRVNNCLECGKCTANCPISRFSDSYSPRLNVGQFIQGYADQLIKDDRLWACLTCGMCNVRCPSDVKYTEFMKQMRFEAFQDGREATCSHGGAIQSLMRIMTSPSLNQNRLEWVPKELKFAEKGELVYFVGCLPYFDALFTELEVHTLDTAKGVLTILNHLNTTPVLLKNERCCGHDLLWSGDIENFKKLAKHNLAEIKGAGAKKVLFSCAEGYRTFKLDYPQYFGQLDFEVIHISEFVAEQISSNGLKFGQLNRTVTYQDPCRLGRHMNVYDPPREIMAHIPGLELVEMAKNRNTAVCCGTSAWMNCDITSKQIQTYRLKSAKSTGADLFVTSCPKCYIHFKCAQKDEKIGDQIDIEIQDLATLAALAL